MLPHNALYRKHDIPADLLEFFEPADCGQCYVCHVVECFRAVRRVLRDDGCLFLNLGDAYTSGNRATWHKGDSGKDHHRTQDDMPRPVTPSGLKPKDLIGQPWRIAFALQADGWILRSALPWVKRSAMPEAVTDRPTSALEYVFLLTKSPKYYWDAEAVRVKAAPATHQRDKYSRILADDGPQAVRHDHETQVDPGGRNFRNTDLFFESLKPPYGMIFAGDEPVGLDVTSAGLNEKHFASFPRKLIRPLILASTSEKGCCPECGTPWVRQTTLSGGYPVKTYRGVTYDPQAIGATLHVARTQAGLSVKQLATRFPSVTGGITGCVWNWENGVNTPTAEQWHALQELLPTLRGSFDGLLEDSGTGKRSSWGKAGDALAIGAPSAAHTLPRGATIKTLGWKPGCECVNDEGLTYEMHDGETGKVAVPYNPVPAVVLDPFVGSGQSLIVATQQGRRGIGIDASAEYCEMARRRIADPEPEAEIPDVDGQMMFGELEPEVTALPRPD